MTSATPLKNPKNVYHIGGIPVEFPYQPYGSQLAFMGRVISTLDRAQRDGHCHALLESPTGTGKSLSLLCSALAWQKNYKPKDPNADVSHSKPDPEALADPLGHGGGFIPETDPSSIPEPENSELASAVNGKKKRKKRKPTIFYASRTHTQISQVIREYRKTAYRVPMSVLASRKHYCTNKKINAKANIDEECKLLVRDEDVGCPAFKNMHKVKGHPSLQKGGSVEVHDIEDLVQVAQVVKGCAYYAARDMADNAQLVFCPYNYIINPIIRGAMELDIEGAILILDEAHNIEDMARDAGSVDVNEDALHKLQTELGKLCRDDAMIYQPLFEMTQDIICWIERKKSTLEKREFQHYFSCWTGEKAIRELQEANISQHTFPILQECARKAIKAAIDVESRVDHLSGMSVITLEGLYSSLSYFFSENGVHTVDYQLAVQRYVKKDTGGVAGSWTCTFSLWCLNPAVVFRGIADLSLSVILTSGTLSPMNSFSSELGVQFGTCLEAPHVIDVESQLWAAVISSGPDNYPLNASYKTADAYAFQDALGKSLEQIFKIVPGGTLVFFPSYKLMEKLCSRWHETGQWSQLNKEKFLFVEPRGGSQDDFEPMLKAYYESVRRGTKPTLGRKRKTKKMDLTQSDGKESQDPKKKGAAFLAVFRGKVSEGIDFSDEYGRSVIIVGIPFPNTHDIQVAQKKRYNDMYKSSKDLLSGSEWYCNQAFRALNQAAGRCIRHRFDYGGIIFLDERFREERNTSYISKWLRKSIRQYDSFDISLERLKSFFIDAKEQVGQKAVNVSQCAETKEEIISFLDESNGSTRKKNQKLNSSDLGGQKVVSSNTISKKRTSQLCRSPTIKYNTTFFQKLVRVDDDDFSSSKVYIDLECSPEKDSRCSKATSPTSSLGGPEVSIVKETPVMDGNITQASPVSSKDENSSSTIVQASTEFPDPLLFCSKSNCSGPPSRAICSLVVTPEKDFTANTSNLMPEIESPLSLSVNSRAQKRRKSMVSSLTNPTQAEPLDSPDAKALGRIGNSMVPRDANRRIEFGSGTNSSEEKVMKSSIPELLTMNHTDTLPVSSFCTIHKKLQIFCSLCRNPLGLPENDLYVTCSLTSSSKVHLASLIRGSLESSAVNAPTSIPVVVSDSSSVNEKLHHKDLVGSQGNGVWCEEDGCVFNAIYCPFCVVPKHCLGVQIMATDASNVELLNKILFYFDRLEIKNPESSRDEDLSPARASNSQVIELDPFEKFSYKPKEEPEQNENGWRTTKSKLRLPKSNNNLHSNSRSQCGIKDHL